MRPLSNFVILIVLATCCFTLMLFATRKGPGVTPDSNVYMAAAKSISAGHGLLVDGKWLTHFPPGFPVLLGLLISTTGDPVSSGRYLNAMLFAVNACLIWLLTLRTTRSLRSALIVVALFVTWNSVDRIYANVWSEPLFLALMFLALLRFEEGDETTTAILLALATATRWAGLGLIFGFIGALAIEDRGLGRRAARFAGISLALPALVVLSNKLLAGNTTNRKLQFEPGLFVSHAMDGIRTMGTLVLPDSTPLGIKAAVLGFMCALACWLCLEKRPFVRTLCILALAYTAFVACSLIFADPLIVFDVRMLSPALCLAFVASCSAILERRSRPALMLSILLCPAVALGLIRTFRWLV